MGPLAAKVGIDALKGGGNFAKEHWKGITAIVGGAVLALTLSGGCNGETGISNEESITVTTQPPEIYIIEGTQLPCFEKQTAGVPVKGYQRDEVSVSIFGRTPIDNVTWRERSKEQKVEGITRLCAAADDTEIRKIVQEGQPTKLEVNIKEFTVVADGILPKDPNNESTSPALLDRLTPFTDFDDKDIEAANELVGLYTLGKYACNDFSLQIAKKEATSYFVNLANVIGGIEAVNVSVQSGGIAKIDTNFEPGKIDSAQLAQEIGVDKIAGFDFEIGDISCGAISVDNQGQAYTYKEISPTKELTPLDNQQAAGIPG